MSWVPIVGSALGSFLGGLISDYVIKVNVENDSCENSTGNGNGDDLDVDKSAHAATALMINTTIHSKKVNKFVAGRALIAGITCLLSLPLVAYSFYLDSPGCFLIYIASGMVSTLPPSSLYYECCAYSICYLCRLEKCILAKHSH